jgi:transposase-like protein
MLMNPQTQFCPNSECNASGKDGHIGIHSRAEKRYRCHRCKRTFSESYGTAMYGLKHCHQLFVTVVSLLAYGCPVQAIVATYHLDERTVWSWLERAGKQCQSVHEGELGGAALELHQIQADELKIKTFVGVIWMGLVMMVGTRLWLGGAVSQRRGKNLLRRVFEFAARFGREGDLLIGVDGFNIYLHVIPEVFQKSWNWLEAQGQGWTTAVVQTLKQKGNKRGRIDREIAWGEPAFIRRLIGQSQGKGWINSAYIERLNATFRAHMSCLTRDGRAILRQEAKLEAWMWLVGTVYNWATYHQSLSIELTVSKRKRYWLKRSPAIASQLTEHLWTVEEILTWKRPTSGAFRKQFLWDAA